MIKITAKEAELLERAKKNKEARQAGAKKTNAMLKARKLNLKKK